MKEGKVPGLCTHSTGNNGAAVAFCGEKFNLPTTVVMPTDSPMIKRKNVKGYGAELIIVDSPIEHRLAEVKRLETELGYKYMPAYDHYDIVTG
jgi:threonine dehydratase